MFEVCDALLRRESPERACDLFPQFSDSCGCRFSERRLELCEHHLDGIEVRAVRRQIEEPRALCLDGLTNASHFMAWQVVHHDDVAWSENRCQKLFGPGPKGLAIHRPVERHGRVEAVTAQGRDKGRRAPVTMRGFGHEPLTNGAAARATHHVGGKA